MKRRKTFEEERRPLTVEEIERRGYERVRRRTRQVLVDRARHCLGPDAAAELEAIDGDEALLDRVLQLLSPPGAWSMRGPARAVSPWGFGLMAAPASRVVDYLRKTSLPA